MFNEEIRDMDFSGGIRATRVFQEAMPAPNALFVQMFMTFIELLKVSPDGVEMSDLRTRIHTTDKKVLNKQTFSRWVTTMASEGKEAAQLFSLDKKKKRKPLIELVPSTNDPRAKKIILTETGLRLAQRMSRIKSERSGIDIILESYKNHVDWMASEEMNYAKSLFEQGYTINDVETAMEKWREENPDKTWFSQRYNSFEFPVPPSVTADWLEQFQNDDVDEAEMRQMLEQVGLFNDDIMLRMMFSGKMTRDGWIRMDIPKDAYKNREDRMSSITYKFVARSQLLKLLSGMNWDQSGLEIVKVVDELGDEFVLKQNARGPHDFDVVNKKTGEVEGGVQVKATTNHPAASPDVTAIITMFTQQIDDLKKESAEREQKLLERIDKLSEQLRENSRG